MKLEEIVTNKFIVYPIVAIVSYFVFSNLWLIAMLIVASDTFYLINRYNDTYELSIKDYFHLALSVPLYLSIISFTMPKWFAPIPAFFFAVKIIARIHENFDEKLNHNNRPYNSL